MSAQGVDERMINEHYYYYYWQTYQNTMNVILIIHEKEKEKKRKWTCANVRQSVFFNATENEVILLKIGEDRNDLFICTRRANLAKINLLGKQAVHCDRSCCYLKLSSKQQHHVFNETDCAREIEYFDGIKVVTRHASVQLLRDQWETET